MGADGAALRCGNRLINSAFVISTVRVAVIIEGAGQQSAHINRI